MKQGVFDANVQGVFFMRLVTWLEEDVRMT